MLCQALVLAVTVQAEMTFEEFKVAYGKVYNGIEEEMRREAVFAANVERISTHNKKQLTYTMAVNQFADLEEDEFLAQYTGLLQSTLREDAMMGFLDLPEAQDEAVDWVQRGAVNAVKDQLPKKCGACWAFSTVGVLESAYQISTGQLLDLAEQQLVDCDSSNNGCLGGWPHNAYDKYVTGHGMCTQASYSYTGQQGSCKDSSCTVAVPKGFISGHHDVVRTASALKSAIASQPVSVTVHMRDWQFYANGVVTAGCTGQVDHAVIAVGYGTDGQDYFKIRNSLGSSWGEGGYIRLAQNSSSSEGTACLLQAFPVVPTLSSDGCVDHDDAITCNRFKSVGECESSSQYYDYMKQHCCKTCGFGSMLQV